MPGPGGLNPADLAELLGGAAGGGLGAGGLRHGGRGEFGKRHRRINPANVRALNRSLRRVEKFEHLAARVFKHKLFKRVRGPAPFHLHRKRKRAA